ncbi:MAG TPA: hypothetical protein VFL57_05025 [Bryobacteraceae bacterium]|nr:hypothetical protein [Bryobacteraceae bacterium]
MRKVAFTSEWTDYNAKERPDIAARLFTSVETTKRVLFFRAR